MTQCQLVILRFRGYQIDWSLRKHVVILDCKVGNKHSGLMFSLLTLILVHIALLFIAYWECTTSPQRSLGNDWRYWGCSVHGVDVPWGPSLMVYCKMLVNCFNPQFCPRFNIHCLFSNSAWEEDMTRNSVWDADVWENMWLLGKRDLFFQNRRNERRFSMISRGSLHFPGNHQWKPKRTSVVGVVQQRECNSSVNLSSVFVEQELMYLLNFQSS